MLNFSRKFIIRLHACLSYELCCTWQRRRRKASDYTRDENKLERYYVCKIFLAAFCYKKINVYFLKYKNTEVITIVLFSESAFRRRNQLKNELFLLKESFHSLECYLENVYK